MCVTLTHAFMIGGLLRFDRGFKYVGLSFDQGVDIITYRPARWLPDVSLSIMESSDV